MYRLGLEVGGEGSSGGDGTRTLTNRGSIIAYCVSIATIRSRDQTRTLTNRGSISVLEGSTAAPLSASLYIVYFRITTIIVQLDTVYDQYYTDFKWPLTSP